MKDHSDQSQYKYKRQRGMMTGLMITVSSIQVREKHKKHRNVALIKKEWFSCHDGGLDIYHKLGILHDSFNCPLGIKATCTGSDSTSFLRFSKTRIALILMQHIFITTSDPQKWVTDWWRPRQQWHQDQKQVKTYTIVSIFTQSHVYMCTNAKWTFINLHDFQHVISTITHRCLLAC